MNFTPDPGWHNDPRDGDADSRHDNGTYHSAQRDMAVIRAIQGGARYTNVIARKTGLSNPLTRKVLNDLEAAEVVACSTTMPFSWRLT